MNELTVIGKEEFSHRLGKENVTFLGYAKIKKSKVRPIFQIIGFILIIVGAFTLFLASSGTDYMTEFEVAETVSLSSYYIASAIFIAIGGIISYISNK
mgnify:CR=1 FL=1